MQAAPAAADAPRAEEWQAFYLRAFDLLRFDRQFGAMGGQSPISFGAYDAFARRYGIEGEAFEILIAMMTAIDTEWLAHVAEEERRERERTKSR